MKSKVKDKKNNFAPVVDESKGGKAPKDPVALMQRLAKGEKPVVNLYSNVLVG